MNNKYPLITILLISFLAISCKQDRKTEIFQKDVRNINKLCPLKVDSIVILDSASYNSQECKITYHYSASGSLDDSIVINKNYDKIEQALIDGFENSVDMRKYKKYNVGVEYKYYSGSKGNLLATFNLSSDSLNTK